MGFFSKKQSDIFPWKTIESDEALMSLIEVTNEKPVLFFKHSTRCSISTMAKHRFEQEWDNNNSSVELCFIDLLRFRSVSNLLTELSGVQHQSPQVIVLFAGEVLYEGSHSGIQTREIRKMLSNTQQVC